MLVLPRRVRPWVLFGIGVFRCARGARRRRLLPVFGDVLSVPVLPWGASDDSRLGIHSRKPLDAEFAVARHRSAVRAVARRPARPAADPMPAPRRRVAPAMVCLAALAAVGAVLSAPRVPGTAALDQMFRDRAVVEQLGPFGFHAYDAWSYARSSGSGVPRRAAEDRRARAWLLPIAGPFSAGAGPYSGLAHAERISSSCRWSRCRISPSTSASTARR